MEKGFFKTTFLHQMKNKPDNKDVVNFNLPVLIDKISQKQTRKDTHLNTLILLNEPTIKIVLTVIQKGTEISSIHANKSITFQVLTGKMKLHFGNESLILNQGQLFTLFENINYILTTNEETAFLLTITTNIFMLSEN